MHFTKHVVIGVISIALAVSLTGCDNPIEKIFTKEKNEDTIAETVNQVKTEINSYSTSVSVVDILDETSVESTVSEEYCETGGGNADTYKEIEITVSDNQYFYNNHEITLSEVCEILDSLDSNTTIILFDEMATESAFSKITDYLDERKISYEMK
ncbi:hypothetical protein [Huintestinicola sp.]|uniref:hypothetical protein n=1 Tax=Huintestinicola sp. TaxID=2981661 RepID=UPI003D7CC833